jgi:hypothetical protein
VQLTATVPSLASVAVGLVYETVAPVELVASIVMGAGIFDITGGVVSGVGGGCMLHLGTLTTAEDCDPSLPVTFALYWPSRTEGITILKVKVAGSGEVGGIN